MRLINVIILVVCLLVVAVAAYDNPYPLFIFPLMIGFMLGTIVFLRSD